jgi:hypothetical protein
VEWRRGISACWSSDLTSVALIRSKGAQPPRRPIGIQEPESAQRYIRPTINPVCSLCIQRSRFKTPTTPSAPVVIKSMAQIFFYTVARSGPLIYPSTATSRLPPSDPLSQNRKRRRRPSPTRLILGIVAPNFNSTALHVAVIKADLGEVSIPGIACAGVPSMGRSSFTAEGKVRRTILVCLVINSTRKRHKQLPDGTHKPTT